MRAVVRPSASTAASESPRTCSTPWSGSPPARMSSPSPRSSACTAYDQPSPSLGTKPVSAAMAEVVSSSSATYSIQPASGAVTASLRHP
jgi:hypothetical protein